MNTYEGMTDKIGNPIGDRTCIFINFSNIDANGNFEQYRISEIITTDNSGVLLVIDKSDLNRLHNHKLSFDGFKPKLITK